MKKAFLGSFFVMLSSISVAQTYDSSTLVDTNNNSTSTSTVTSTNTNNNTNINTNTTTVNSTAVNTNTNTSISENLNVNTTTSDNTNRNINDSTNRNISTSSQTVDSNNNNYNRNDVNQKIEQPPPTAVAPAMMSGGNADLCTTGVSGAVQTQIFGLSFGTTVTDKNCERLKLSKTLFDMGMKVAAVATMCQDRRVFDAMWDAGTPCPFEGKIGEQARLAWLENPHRVPKADVPTAEAVR